MTPVLLALVILALLAVAASALAALVVGADATFEDEERGR